MNVLSLFAGIGGIDLGLERIGCTTRWYSEVEPYACKVMAKRFPDAVNLGDITAIDWTSFNERIDIICGGFPCQDISVAGKRAGITEGTRSGLWSYYADAIRALRPQLVIVENVAALLARGLNRVLGDLAACGYDAEWDCIPSASIGAPHRRDRIFIIAYPQTLQRPSIERNESHRDHAGVGKVADTHSAGLEGHGRPFERTRERVASTGGAAQGKGTADIGRDVYDAMRGRHGAQETVLRSRWNSPEHSSWWSVEPDVGRVAHGIPARVDRLRCLGNAVVPQVAEHVGRIALGKGTQ